MAVTEPNEQELRSEVREERTRLAEAVDTLRAELGQATDVGSKLRAKLPAAAAAAFGLGFVASRGIGATMRLLMRRSREGKFQMTLARLRLGRRAHERVEVELEGAPDALEERRVQLAEPALDRARRLARVQERLARPLVRRLDLQRRVQLLDGPLRVGQAPLDDARDVPALVRQPAADGRVDAGDLEQRNIGVVQRDVVASNLEDARVELRPQRRRLRRERLRQGPGAPGRETRRVELRGGPAPQA